MIDDNDDAEREDAFLDGLVPQVFEHIAEQRAQDFDAEACQSRFLAWLDSHAQKPAAAMGRPGTPSRYGVFISYPHADSNWPVRWLADRLSGQLGADVVFPDADAIQPGNDSAAKTKAARRDKLAQRRKTLGLTQEDLAAILKVERTTVARWERGESNPLPWMRHRLARALMVSLDRLQELLDGEAR